MKFLTFQIMSLFLVSTSAQMCVKLERVAKTRQQWNNGERMVTKRNFWGGIKYKYEPYVYSTVLYYTDYETRTVCCSGYQKINEVCEPQCDEGCSDNSHCTRPDICECDSGYSGFPSIGIKCKPQCKNKCPENAECSLPNICRCTEGFKVNVVNNECEPICSKPCTENSICSAPEKCTCKQNYKFNHDTNMCEPICDCGKYEMCIEPNKCECLDGYERSESDNVCIPKCYEKCLDNAVCSAPNQCTCKEGYEHNLHGICEPICNPLCPANSICTEPNKCECSKGYNMLNNSCQPICKQCPTNSVCTSPNKCDCINGYQKKLTSLYEMVCEPVCKNCSTFAKCTAPNKCECLNGYEMDEIEQCRPICQQGCQNGICFSPNNCICKPGYLMGPKGVCEPVCSRTCKNGSCVEPEICECLEGYKFQEKSINVCEPICEPNCINGLCIAPNLCICHENFVPIENENGLNHSICESISTTTTEQETEFSEEAQETTSESFISSKYEELGKLEKSPHENNTQILKDITTASYNGQHMVAAEICSHQCQCWQEYDEFGSINDIKCQHLCVDEHDEPCLNLRLCQCEQDRLELHCNLDTEDFPLVYSCKRSIKAEGSLQQINQNQATAEPSNGALWTWILIISIATVIAAAGVAYVYSRRIPEQPQDNPILDCDL